MYSPEEFEMSDWKSSIVSELKQEVGSLPPNTRFYPIRKLMSRFGTSQRTIEQVMKQLIAESAVVHRPGSGYFTRDLSPKRQLHYRLILPKWVSNSLKQLEQDWCDYARNTGEFRFSSRMQDRSSEFFRAFPADDCDALLVVPPAGPISRDGLRYICSLPIPVVIVSHEVADLGLSMISGNASAGGAIAAAHLINNGHRKLAMLVTEPHCSGLDMRCQGFSDFARLTGVSVAVIETNAESWNNNPHRAYECLSAYLDQNGLDFTGLFVISGHPILEVYKAFSDHGISIPNDVSVVAHDDPPSARFLCPPLDCIRNDEMQQVSVAHAEIQKVVEGKNPFFHLRQEPVLLSRGSVRNLSILNQEKRIP